MKMNCSQENHINMDKLVEGRKSIKKKREAKEMAVKEELCEKR